MTRDHRRKKAVRARAADTGRSYLDVATSLTGSGGPSVLADPVRGALAAALGTAGWPVQVEYHPQAADLRTYAGPATVTVSRSDFPAGGLTGDEHPDDPAVFDLASPLRVEVTAPLVTDFSPELGRVAGVDAPEIPANQPPAAIVSQIDQVVGAARRRDLADLPQRDQCGVCGDHYAASDLLTPVDSDIRVCPCCPFDGDLLRAHPARLAFDIDQAFTRDLALAAGWAAAQVLLCCLRGPDMAEWLHDEWRADGVVYEPLEPWSDPAAVWIWLPPAPRRPAALAGLGCGASLAAVTAALGRAHPNLRARFQARQDEETAEYLEDAYGDDVRPGDDDGLRLRAEIVDRFWPAVIAYAVAMLTQQAERPGRRVPWHVLESFELGEWIRILDPDLDGYQVETVLRVGILTIRDILDPASAHDD